MEPITTGTFELSLVLEHRAVVETASIPFRATLRNTGEAAKTVRDFSPANQTVTLAAEAPDGTLHLGTQISWKKRNGERFHAPRLPSEFELPAGAERSLEGDAIAWLGRLPAGTYALYAAYNSGPNVYAESEPVEVRIHPARAVQYHSAASPIQPAFSLTQAAWQHRREEGGVVMYQQLSSPHYPPNLFRNRPVAELDEMVEAFPSTTILESVPKRHICWLVTPHTLRVVTVDEATGATSYRDVTMPVPAERLLRSPLSDEDEQLHVLAASRDRQDLLYTRIPNEGSATTRTVGAMPIDLSVYALMWGREGRVHLVGKERQGRQLLHLQFRLSDAESSAIVELVSSVKGTPRAMDLLQTYDTTTNTHHETGVGLSYVVEQARWQQWSLALDKAELQRASSFDVLNTSLPSEAHVVAHGLTSSNEQVYLFANADEEIWLVRAGAEGAVPVFDAAQQRLLAAHYPVLHLPSPLSHREGVYVAYLPEEGPVRFIQLPN